MIEWLNIWLTNRCNRSCQHCAHKDAMQVPHDTSVDELIELGGNTCGIRNFSITGGEPTLHLDFHRIAREARGWLNAKILDLQTNGVMFDRFQEPFTHFDMIHVSDYGDNCDQIALMRHYLRGARTELVVTHPVHVPDKRDVGEPHSCHLQNTPVYWRGRIWPCCPGPAVKDCPSISLTADWLEQLKTVQHPCSNCRFGFTQ